MVDKKNKKTILISDGFSFFNKAWEEGKIKKPVIILIGGHIGTGKTTFAEMLKSKIPHSSLITTAIIRSILQSLIPENALPELHMHTYDFPLRNKNAKLLQKEAIESFEVQAKAVDQGLKKLISFFESEKQLSIIEGNHILPSTVKKLQKRSNIISLFFKAPEDELYKKTISGQTHKREVSLEQFKIVRLIHDYLIFEAKRNKQILFCFGETKSAMDYIETKLIEIVEEYDKD